MAESNTKKYSEQVVYPTKYISSDDTIELLKLSENDINLKLIYSYFAASLNTKQPRFNTYDIMIIPANRFSNNKSIESTIGSYIFNMFAVPESYFKKHGYINDTLTKKNMGKIEEQMALMILNDEMSISEYNTFLNKIEWLGMVLTKCLVPSLSYNFLKPLPGATKEKERLFNQYSEEIKAGNSDVIQKIENELKTVAEAELKELNDPSYELFNSGVFKFDNYKKTSLMGGAFKDIANGKLELIKSNYVDGINKDEYRTVSQVGIIAGYSRGVDTAKGGDLTKQINSAMQNTILDDDPESDCGTKAYLNIKLYDELKSMYMYRYILDNNKLILLDENNINSYINKNIKLRTPMYCNNHNGKICAKCAGLLYYKIGVKNVGLLSGVLSNSIMQKSMSKFHSLGANFDRIEYSKYTSKF